MNKQNLETVLKNQKELWEMYLDKGIFDKDFCKMQIENLSKVLN